MLLKIYGKGNISAGKYEDIKVKGNVKLDGTVKCTNFKGSGKIKGQDLECAELCKMAGRSNFAEKLKAKELKTAGNFSCGGDLDAEVMLSKGVVKCNGSVNADNVVASGVLKAGNGINVNMIKIKGAITCNKLKSKDVELIVSGTSNVDAIACDKINVHTKGFGKFCMQVPLISILFKKLNKIAVANDVVGKEVYVENLTASKLIGNNIIIGKGCNIDLVQYCGQINISKKAKVKKIEKID